MIKITFSKGGSGPVKAPMSMKARMLLELQLHGLTHHNAYLPAQGIRIIAPEPLPLTSVAGILFNLKHHPAHLAGHYPHSHKTPQHVIELGSDELHDGVSRIFKHWPRVLVRLKKYDERATPA